MKLSGEMIDNSIRNLIMVSSQYPDDKLAKAIDDVRLIIRHQQICIEQMKEKINGKG